MIQLLERIGDILQFGAALYVFAAGFKMKFRGWPRTVLDERAGEILMVLGAVLALMLRAR